MKKLSLNASAFKKGEALTRSQLKKILGGASPCNYQCNVDADCPGDHICINLPQCPSGHTVCAQTE